MRTDVAPDDVTEMLDITKKLIEFIGDNLDVASPYHGANALLILSTAIFDMIGMDVRSYVPVVTKEDNFDLIRDVQALIISNIKKSYE